MVGKVLVVGSANLDTSIRVAAHPHPGETVLGTRHGSGAGGKGLNQAIGSARSGAQTTFVGALGDDLDADTLLEALREANVRTCVGTSSKPTGLALVMVASSGENAIVVDSGANSDSEAISAPLGSVVRELGQADILLAQLEVPLVVVTAAFRAARARGARTVLNAAPSQNLPSELLDSTSILVVNEHECEQIAGADRPGAEAGARALSHRVPMVVVTLGSEGALLAVGGTFEKFDAIRVDAVDTTAAGDTFCGAMSAQLVLGATLHDAIRFGMAAAALAVQRYGASDSIPSRAEVADLLAHHLGKTPC